MREFVMIFRSLNRTRISVLVLSFFMAASTLAAQNIDKEVIAEIGPEKITVEEFLRIYQKNNAQAAELDPKSLEEYLELFINFRLKVLEAEEVGLHNEQSFKDELAGYRTQLAKPYLLDEEALDELVKDAHRKMQEDLRASHLLIRVERNAAPEDTLVAWNRVAKLRERIIKGEKFAEVAQQESEDQSARDREASGRVVSGNKGDLGYFTVFDMVYPFETAAYQLKKGEVSKPIRTDFGYHLIHLTDRKPAMGQVLAAHILLLFPPEPKAKDSTDLEEKARMVYERLQQGETFEDMARDFSDDRSTSTNGGVLQKFGSNRMIPEFIYNISKLKPGQYSEPFQTHFGWHIIKLIEQEFPANLEDSYASIKERVQRNERSTVVKNSLVKRIKNEYGFKESPKSREIFNSIVTDSIFAGNWEIPPRTRLNRELFSIGTQKMMQQDFADYLLNNQKRTSPENLRIFVARSYNDFVEKTLLDYEDRQLERKYPEFKALITEYRDGILLFELTDRKIWSKAVQDTTGLMRFHADNDSKYMWGERADASVFSFTGASQEQLDKAISMASQEISNDEILAAVNQDAQVLSINRRLYSKGDDALIDAFEWTYGPKTPVEKDGKKQVVVIHNVLEPGPKLLNEVRGLVTADYQNYLEQQWIQELRKKFPVRVNRELLSQIR
jgi:peptidyl-prolyl cis-trans isomerase SurA